MSDCKEWQRYNLFVPGHELELQSLLPQAGLRATMLGLLGHSVKGTQTINISGRENRKLPCISICRTHTMICRIVHVQEFWEFKMFIF